MGLATHDCAINYSIFDSIAKELLVPTILNEWASLHAQVSRIKIKNAAIRAYTVKPLLADPPKKGHRL